MTTTDYGTADAPAPLYCANHPKEETYLRCAKCDKPICARCRVHTPAGFRCFECANLQVLPTYAVDTRYYVRAGIAGFAAAAIAGALMGIFPAFEFWAAALMGIAVPEAVSAAANHKRGPGLQMIGMAAVVFGFALSRVVLQSFPFLLPLDGINMPGFFVAPLFGPLPYGITQYTIIWLAMALFLANRRLG